MEKEHCAYKINDKFSFYDFNKLEPKYGNSRIIRIKHDQKFARFGDALNDPEKYKSYALLENELVGIVLMLAMTLDEPQCIFRRYGSKWLQNNEAFPHVEKWLIARGISNRRKSFWIETKDTCFRHWMVCAIRGYSPIQLLLPQNRVILSPTDHMDIFIDAKETQVKEKIIAGVLVKFPNIESLQ